MGVFPDIRVAFKALVGCYWAPCKTGDPIAGVGGWGWGWEWGWGWGWG